LAVQYNFISIMSLKPFPAKAAGFFDKTGIGLFGRAALWTFSPHR
jgi:hypothetical protein